jgi:flagellar FliL protein
MRQAAQNARQNLPGETHFQEFINLSDLFVNPSGGAAAEFRERGASRVSEMAEAEGASGEAKPKSRKKLIVIAAAATVALIGGGVGGYMMFAKGGEHGSAAAASDGHGGGGEHGGDGEAHAAAPAKAAAFVELPEMTVNLATVDKERQQYVRMTVALEVGSPELVEAIKPLLPRVIDSFQTHLREMRPSDLRGSAGAYRLKEELLRRVNVAIAPARADAVLFKDVVVQ